MSTAYPSDPTLRRWPLPLRIAGGVLGAIVLLLLALWFVLFITKGRFLKHRFETLVSEKAGREVRVGGDFQFYFAPFNAAFLAEDMRVSNPSWAHEDQFFTAKKIAFRLRVLPLLLGRRELSWLDLDGASLAPEWDAKHLRKTWDFGPGPSFAIPDVKSGTITATHVDYRDPAMQLIAHVAIGSVETSGRRLDGDIRFTGTGTLRGKPVSFSGGVMDPNATIAGGRANFMFHADAANTIIDVNGAVPSMSRFEGSRLHFAARGGNMADLFGFAGIAVVPTRAYHIASNVAYDGEWWNFTNLTGVFGDSDLAGKMRIGYPDKRMKIDADVATRSLDILDAGPFLGYDPQKLNALGAKGAIRQVGGVPRIIPDATIPVASLGAFDADVRYKVGEIRGKNFPVSDIYVALSLDHSLLKVDPARADLAGGTLTAALALNARRTPVTEQYDVRLSPTPMGHLLARFGVAEAETSGTIAGRIAMHGTGTSVQQSLAGSSGRIAVVIPAGKLSERNIKLTELNLGTFIQKAFQKQLKDPVEVNCGLVAFTVNNGIATADPILIDTRKSVVSGNGGFSFKDESLDLSIRDKSKKFSLFSLQSPVGIGGHMAAPGIRIVSPQLVERAGVAVAAGVFLTPIATLAAFVDFGRAKAAACGPVLAGATAAAQRTTKGDARKDVGKDAPKKK